MGYKHLNQRKHPAQHENGLLFMRSFVELGRDSLGSRVRQGGRRGRGKGRRVRISVESRRKWSRSRRESPRIRKLNFLPFLHRKQIAFVHRIHFGGNETLSLSLHDARPHTRASRRLENPFEKFICSEIAARSRLGWPPLAPLTARSMHKRQPTRANGNQNVSSYSVC